MKAIIFTTTLVATILVSALLVKAADRNMPFDAAKFFEELSTRSGD